MSEGLHLDEHGRQIFTIKPGTELARFVTSDRFMDVIVGPLGSGKSVGWCLRIMRHAQEQRPSPLDGLRYTRWFVARNTYPDLRRTTIRTWLDTFPEETYGRFYWGQPPSHKISFGDVRTEIDFLALDKPEDIRKLRSGEYTGGVFNEVQYIPLELVDEGQSRVDRYPKKSHGGATWAGIICDANAPDEDHWLAMRTGMVDPPTGLSADEQIMYEWPAEWGLFMQPPALIEHLDTKGHVESYSVNPDAENLENLSDKYYSRQIIGKKKSWIDSRLMVRCVLVVDGEPVHPSFRREFHVASKALEPVLGNGHDVRVWMDFGRMPAAAFAQEINGRVYVQHELIGFNEGATTFAPKVKRFLEQNYPGCGLIIHGDPKGADKGQSDERSAYDVFKGLGMPVQPAPVPTNNIEERVDALTYGLNDNPGGVNRWVFSPRCRTMIVGFAGRYCNEKDPEDGQLKPTKNKYSHICNAVEYGAVSIGEGRRMHGLRPTGQQKAVNYTRRSGGHSGPRGLRRRVS